MFEKAKNNNNILQIIEYGLYLLVFALPIQTRWIIKAGELNKGYWEYGTICLYMTDILLVALLFLFIICKLHKPQFSIFNFQFSKCWYLIAGLELMVFISIFFALEKGVGFFNYGRFLLGVGLFWLIIRANYSEVKLIISILAGIFLQAFIGIWQFFTQSSFACKWLGMAAHRASDLGVSVVEIVGFNGIGERWLRAYGGLDHPNMLAGLLVVGILLTIELIVGNPKYLPCLSFRQKGWQPGKILKYLLLIIFITSLLFTFSRGAGLGLLVGLLVMLFITIAKKNLVRQRKLSEIVLILGIIIFIFFNQYQDLALTRLSKDTRLEAKSRIERIESYKNSWEIIKENRFFGVGIGNYTLALSNKDHFKRESYYYQPVHNVYLLIWSEIGLVGFLFFIGFLSFIFYLLFFAKNNLENKNVDILRISLFLALLAMLVVDHWWWSLHFGILFFWLIMAMMLRNNKNT